MKKILNLIGIIALAALIGFSFTVCNNNINNGDPKDDDKKVSTTSITLSGTITILKL